MDTPQVIMILMIHTFRVMGMVKSTRTSNEDLCCPHGSLFAFVF